MSTKKQTCGHCKYLDVRPDAAGRFIARRGYAYLCTVPVMQPVVPESMLKYHSWKWPPNRIYMERGDGEGCKLFERRTSEKARKP